MLPLSTLLRVNSIIPREVEPVNSSHHGDELVRADAPPLSCRREVNRQAINQFKLGNKNAAPQVKQGRGGITIIDVE